MTGLLLAGLVMVISTYISIDYRTYKNDSREIEISYEDYCKKYGLTK